MTTTQARVIVLQIPTWEFVELAEKHNKLMHLVMTWMSRKITIKMKNDALAVMTEYTHLPLRTLPSSPIGSPRGSPRKKKLQWDDDDDDSMTDSTTGLRLRQNTL